MIYLFNKNTGNVENQFDETTLTDEFALSALINSWNAKAREVGQEIFYTPGISQWPPAKKKIIQEGSIYKIVDKTQDELILDGELQLPNDKKIVYNSIVDKTDDELYTDGIINIAEYRKRKQSALKSKKDEIIAAGFSYDISNIASTGAATGTIKIFECGQAARDKIETLLNYNTTWPFDWLTHYDHGREVVSMTQAEMQAFYSAMLAFVIPINQYYYTNEAYLLTTSANNVAAFDPNTGWP